MRATAHRVEREKRTRPYAAVADDLAVTTYHQYYPVARASEIVVSA